MELWKPIRTFPGYSVSSDGRVANDRTGNFLAMLRNQHGILYVGLSRGGAQFKRSVTVLVADEFLAPPPNDAFDTPINLDGDRSNNYYENLLWRPRWFAIKYFQQFTNGIRGFEEPIVEVDTGEEFKTSWQAATKYGLIDVRIKVAILNKIRVWPTHQLYELM